MEDGGGREESWRGEGGGEGGEWGTGWDLGLRIHPGSENEEAAMGRPWAGGLGGGGLGWFWGWKPAMEHGKTS